MTLKGRTHNIRVAAMLAEEYILNFWFAISFCSVRRFSIRLFVGNFNFVFLIGLGFRAGRSSNPAQQQPLSVACKFTEMTNIIKFIFLVFLFASCKGPSMVGYWKIGSTSYYKKIDSISNKANDAGDLIFSSDSTYLIKGYDNKESNIPGWHTGGDEKGTWRGSTKELLVLFPDSYSSLVPDSWTNFGRTIFKVVHLTKNKLVLSCVDSTRRIGIDGVIKYRRS